MFLSEQRFCQDPLLCGVGKCFSLKKCRNNKNCSGRIKFAVKGAISLCRQYNTVKRFVNTYFEIFLNLFRNLFERSLAMRFCECRELSQFLRQLGELYDFFVQLDRYLAIYLDICHDKWHSSRQMHQKKKLSSGLPILLM